MKKYLKEAVILFIMVILVTNIVSFFRTKDLKVDNLALLKEYKTIDNKEIAPLLESKKPLVLNFWGTWCPVCNQEISTIDKIAKDKDVVLITIAVNSGNDSDIKKYMKEKGVDFIVINDKNGKLAQAFNIEVFPTTIFYNIKRDKTIKDSGYLSYMGYLARKKLVE
jgi:thiol-disulfide isomerase/thioredoxin